MKEPCDACGAGSGSGAYTIENNTNVNYWKGNKTAIRIRDDGKKKKKGPRDWSEVLDRFSSITGADAFLRKGMFANYAKRRRNIWKWDDYKNDYQPETYSPNKVWGEYNEIEKVTLGRPNLKKFMRPDHNHDLNPHRHFSHSETVFESNKYAGAKPYTQEIDYQPVFEKYDEGIGPIPHMKNRYTNIHQMNYHDSGLFLK